MPLPTIPDVLRAQVRGVTPAGTLWANTWHFSKGSALSTTTAINQINTILDTAYSSTGWTSPVLAGIGSLCHTSWQKREILITPLYSNLASTLFTTVRAGTSPTDALPPDVAGVISIRTALRGPRYRGRVFVAGFTEGANDSGGRMSASVQTVLQNIGERIRTEAIAGTMTLGVASYKFSSFEVASQCVVDTVFDRQRRRAR